MPKPARPWFRFYVEAFADRKLRREKPEHRWLFAACIGAARQSSQPPWLLVGDDRMLLADLADFAGMPERQVKQGLARLLSSGLLAEDDRGWFVPAFDRRQFESDNVTARTAKHRSKERSMERSDGVRGNAPDTEAETDTTPQPPHSGGDEHLGQHPNCRACGTNPRGAPTPAPTATRHRPVTDVLASLPPVDVDLNRSAVAALKAHHTPEDA